jgi:hypothetical protein
MRGKVSGAACLAALFLLCAHTAHAAGAAGGGAAPDDSLARFAQVQMDCRFLAYGLENTTPLGTEPTREPASPETAQLHARISAMLPASMPVHETLLSWAVDTKTLSAPTITLTPGQEGYVTVATEIDYVRGYEYDEDGDLVPTTGSVSDGVEMRCQAMASGEGDPVEIRYGTEIRQSDLTGEQTMAPVVYAGKPRGRRVRTSVSQPALARRSIETTCRAADKGIVIPSGFGVLESRRCRTGVPVLRSIPLLGRVFGGTSVRHTGWARSEIMRPVVIILGEPMELPQPLASEILPTGPTEPQFADARQVVVRLWMLRFVADKGGAIPAALARLPDDWQMLGRRLAVPDILAGQAVPVAQRLLTAAPGEVSQREVFMVALEGAPFEVQDETDHTYLGAFTFDEAGRPLPDVRELTEGLSLTGTAHVQDDGRIAVKAGLRVARLAGYMEERLQVPSKAPDGTTGPPHRLRVDEPCFAAAELAIDECLAPGETCILDVHGTPRGSTSPQVSVYMLTADILEEAPAEDGPLLKE